MRHAVAAALSSILALAACTQPSGGGDAGSSADPSGAQAPEPASASANQAVLANAAPATKPGGGRVAEPSGVKGSLSISIRWSAEIVTGIEAEGLATSV